MSGDPQVRFGGRGHRNQSMLPTPMLTWRAAMEREGLAIPRGRFSAHTGARQRLRPRITLIICSCVLLRKIDPPIGVAHLPHLVALKLAAAVDVKPIEGLSHEPFWPLRIMGAVYTGMVFLLSSPRPHFHPQHWSWSLFAEPLLERSAPCQLILGPLTGGLGIAVRVWAASRPRTETHEGKRTG